MASMMLAMPTLVSSRISSRAIRRPWSDAVPDMPPTPEMLQEELSAMHQQMALLQQERRKEVIGVVRPAWRDESRHCGSAT